MKIPYTAHSTGLLFSLAALAAGAVAFQTARAATVPSTCAGPRVTLHVHNALPTFLKFYRKAVAEHLTPSQRWILWKKDYGIAAVPPTAQGRALARMRLARAWNRYRLIVPNLRRDARRAEVAARCILPQVARLLHPGSQPIDVNLVLFVGQFSGNAYTVPGLHGAPSTVYLPLEMSYPMQRIALAHEFTHAVHEEVGHLKNMYLEPLGETLLKEGIAMHASRQLVPGQPVTAYTPAAVYGGQVWQKTCESKWRNVLVGMLPYLHSESVTTMERFTTGRGTTGMHDEVYCGGWVLVGDLLKQGYTYARLVRIPEKRMPQFVAKVIETSLAASHKHSG